MSQTLILTAAPKFFPHAPINNTNCLSLCDLASCICRGNLAGHHRTATSEERQALQIICTIRLRTSQSRCSQTVLSLLYFLSPAVIQIFSPRHIQRPNRISNMARKKRAKAKIQALPARTCLPRCLRIRTKGAMNTTFIRSLQQLMIRILRFDRTVVNQRASGSLASPLTGIQMYSNKSYKKSTRISIPRMSNFQYFEPVAICKPI